MRSSVSSEGVTLRIIYPSAAPRLFSTLKVYLHTSTITLHYLQGRLSADTRVLKLIKLFKDLAQIHNDSQT